jgi:23S rRNA pseudouridine2605 synthase
MKRLQKLLAETGLASRRTVEQWIRDGRVTVGGRIAQLGDKASATDEVCLDGRRLELPYGPAATELLLYYKPVGEVTTRSDPQGRPTVFERLPAPGQGRWITVGRLDVNTAGLLLLTTDGELAHRLMHPSSEIEREYLVRVRGQPGTAVLRQLLDGVNLEDGPAAFERISPAQNEGVAAGHSTYRVVLREGRNREVRRLWQAVGFDVSRLLRLRYGTVELPRDLRPGAARRADAGVIDGLKRAVPGTSGAPRGAPAPPEPGNPTPGTRQRPPAGRRGARAAPRAPSRPRPPSK